MSRRYPHPDHRPRGLALPRRLALAASASQSASSPGWWWSVPFWICDRCSCCSSSATRRARCRRRRAQAVVSPADGRIVAVENGARSLPRARRAEGQRVHERVQRAFQPRAGGRRGAAGAGTTPGTFLNAALDKASLENERNALWLQTPRRCGRHLRADRGPDRAADPVLRRRPASGWRAGSATASSASVRAWTSICRRIAGCAVELGDKVYASSTLLAELP